MSDRERGSFVCDPKNHGGVTYTSLSGMYCKGTQSLSMIARRAIDRYQRLNPARDRPPLLIPRTWNRRKEVKKKIEKHATVHWRYATMFGRLPLPPLLLSIHRWGVGCFPAC